MKALNTQNVKNDITSGSTKIKHMGKEIKWSVSSNISMNLSTLNLKEPTLLWIKSCVTLPSTFDYEKSGWEWESGWRKIKTKISRLFNEMVCPDEKILSLDYPAYSIKGYNNNKKVVKQKISKSYISVNITFNNEEGYDWLTNYKSRLDGFMLEVNDILQEMVGYENISDEKLANEE